VEHNRHRIYKHPFLTADGRYSHLKRDPSWRSELYRNRLPDRPTRRNFELMRFEPELERRRGFILLRGNLQAWPRQKRNLLAEEAS